MKVTRQTWNLCRILDTTENFKKLENSYEFITNLVLSYGGRIHGSQHSSAVVGTMSHDTIVVYFEVPKDSLDDYLKEEAALFGKVS